MKEKKPLKTRILQISLNIFLVLAFLFASFSLYKNLVFNPLVVSGASMYPTLHEGDYGYADKTSGAINSIQRNSIIIFHPESSPEQIYVKRVIGLPNETLLLRSDDGSISIDGNIIEQNYLPDGVQEMTCNRVCVDANKTIQLGEDDYYVLGDNRSLSLDSAHGIGFVKKAHILGVVKVVLGKCEPGSYQDTATSVCDFNKRHYNAITDWKFF